jgi:FkbM family methyltransferase
MDVKSFLRNTLQFFHLDFSKNLQYDRLTKAILKKVLRTDSHCIDVGAHKGELLALLLQSAPNGKHWAFEPLPAFHQQLQAKYGSNPNLTILPFALSNQNGQTSFQHVVNAPAYSGIRQRKYATKNPQIEVLELPMRCLDEVLPVGQRIDFMKIDVEGAELQVLQGAQQLLRQWQPTLIFESGLGATDHYGNNATDIFSFLCATNNYELFTLKEFLKAGSALTHEQFAQCFGNNSEYYFVAAAKQ